MKRILTFGVFCLLYSISVFSQSVELGKNRFIVKKIDIQGSVDTNNKGYYMYKTRLYDTGSLDMYTSIKQKDSTQVKHLIEEGYDITLPIFIKEFSDFTKNLIGIGAQVWKNGGTIDVNGFHASWENGFIVTNVKPTPAVKITPLDFAKEINDEHIILILSKELEKQIAQQKIKEINYNKRIIEVKDSLLHSGYSEIIPGKGTSEFQLGVTTFDEIVKILGEKYKKRKYTPKDSGFGIDYDLIDFEFLGNKKSNTLYEIRFHNSFKGLTSKGIVLNKSIMRDVEKLYGTSFMNKVTDGIGFAFGREDIDEIDRKVKAIIITK